MTKETIEIMSYWVTIIGLPITVIALIIGSRQLILSKKVERARFWLELRELFATHNEVHFKLRNGGDWTKDNTGPATVEDWAKVDAYVGQFELCHIMLKKGLLDRETFKSQYAYRLNNIIANKIIVGKINAEIDSWGLFVNLCKDFGHSDSFSA